MKRIIKGLLLVIGFIGSVRLGALVTHKMYDEDVFVQKVKQSDEDITERFSKYMERKWFK